MVVRGRECDVGTETEGESNLRDHMERVLYQVSVTRGTRMGPVLSGVGSWMAPVPIPHCAFVFWRCGLLNSKHSKWITL